MATSVLNSFDGTTFPVSGTPLNGSWELVDPKFTCVSLNARAHTTGGTCVLALSVWWSESASGASSFGDDKVLSSESNSVNYSFAVKAKYMKVHSELVSGSCSSFVCDTRLSNAVPHRPLNADVDSVAVSLDLSTLATESTLSTVASSLAAMATESTLSSVVSSLSALATESTLTSVSNKLVTDGVDSLLVKDAAAGNHLANVANNTLDTAGHLNDMKNVDKMRVEVMNTTLAVTGAVDISNPENVYHPLTSAPVSGSWSSSAFNYGAGYFDILIQVSSITTGGTLYLDVSPNGTNWFRTWNSVFINSGDTSASLIAANVCSPYLRLTSRDGMLNATIDVYLCKKAL